MRVLHPYVSLGRHKVSRKYIVCAYIVLDKDQKLASDKLIDNGIVTKRRTDGTYIDCRQFLISIDKEIGTHHKAPQHLSSDEFERQTEDHIWVKAVWPNMGSPESGGVGNYDDPDGDV